MQIGIDVGGTNTDAVLMDGTRVLATVKTATTPDVMVHPSTRPRGNGKNMPTRGFAGAVRARR